MELAFIPLIDGTPHDAILVERARTGGRAMYTKQFIGQVDGQDVALLSIDIWPVGNPVHLYEVYVLRQWRGHGLGTKVVAHVIELTRAAGNDSITVTPKPLDEDIDERRLNRWYRRLGFKHRHGPHDLECRLIDPTQARAAGSD